MVVDLDRSKETPIPPSIFLKTKECKFFGVGSCTKGSSCPFAHSVGELRSRPNLNRTKICHFFQNEGKCYDVDCNFAHGFRERRRVPRDQLPMMHSAVGPREENENLKGRPDANSNTALILDNASEHLICSDDVDAVIVLDVPWTRLAPARPSLESIASAVSAEKVGPFRFQ
eukprot:TRINITY_DN65995_c0_g1_i1.p1 TRINITY_DN65995_c0_g1~~TRINITY_DN65995_c0_g1_i1.p1  ORF type:complete len:172 (-),score=20.90 TRINITY_DN65995_c0_g1_i1:282-797(-)